MLKGGRENYRNPNNGARDFDPLTVSNRVFMDSREEATSIYGLADRKARARAAHRLALEVAHKIIRNACTDPVLSVSERQDLSILARDLSKEIERQAMHDGLRNDF